jgi:tRNA(Ile)-lysidine synthase TilS/MesJ
MDNNLRDTYENYTRNIRYETYKEVWKEALGIHNLQLQLQLPYVILGHNKDDCIENIFTNITHQTKYDNLSGMSTISEVDDIIFLRPLLNITKTEIYNFSRYYNIPHLHNSTPSWSMRGQIRDSIRPALEKWDSKSIQAFIDLSTNVSDLYELMNIQIEELVNKCICNKITENGVSYSSWETRKSLIQTSVLFWKGFLSKLTNIIPSIKSLKVFITQLIQYKKKPHNINTILSVKLHTELFIKILPINNPTIVSKNNHESNIDMCNVIIKYTKPHSHILTSNL